MSDALLSTSINRPLPSRPVLVCGHPECDLTTHDADRWHRHALDTGHTLLNDEDPAEASAPTAPTVRMAHCGYSHSDALVRQGYNGCTTCVVGQPCRCAVPSSPDLAFFEDRAPGSKYATTTCKHCGYHPAAHGVANRPNVCGNFEPKREGAETDLFYCGCRGWD